MSEINRGKQTMDSQAGDQQTEKPRNRGKQSNDDKLFGTEKMRLKLKSAVEDLSHLLSREYAQRSALALVGNRYMLNVRQQQSVLGMAAAEKSIANRKQKSLQFVNLKDKDVVIDGFNALIGLESLLSGGFIFQGVDGFYRDLSSVHGSYKRVQQTMKAIDLIAEFYVQAEIRHLHWYFDKPVSNSGKLKRLIEDLAAEKGYNWQVDLTFATDKDIVAEQKTVITSDAWILDEAVSNYNLLEYVLEKEVYPAVVRLFDK